MRLEDPRFWSEMAHSSRPGEVIGSWASAESILHLRHMPVLEDGGDLRLLAVFGGPELAWIHCTNSDPAPPDSAGSACAWNGQAGGISSSSVTASGRRSRLRYVWRSGVEGPGSQPSATRTRIGSGRSRDHD